jgi:hypothetical protein
VSQGGASEEDPVKKDSFQLPNKRPAAISARQGRKAPATGNQAGFV